MNEHVKFRDSLPRRLSVHRGQLLEEFETPYVVAYETNK
jgi:hypothetical protein